MEKDREMRIRERAYRSWEEEGRPEGKHEEHWHRAARELEKGEDASAADQTSEPARESGKTMMEKRSVVPPRPAT